jgi:hypothetical protein
MTLDHINGFLDLWKEIRETNKLFSSVSKRDDLREMAFGCLDAIENISSDSIEAESLKLKFYLVVIGILNHIREKEEKKNTN